MGIRQERVQEKDVSKREKKRGEREFDERENRMRCISKLAYEFS